MGRQDDIDWRERIRETELDKVRIVCLSICKDCRTNLTTREKLQILRSAEHEQRFLEFMGWE